MNAEIELLETLIKTCRSIRDPKIPRSRTEMAIPAAQWEMRFEARIEEIKHAMPKMNSRRQAVAA